MGMNQIPMTFKQIQFIMRQNPMIKTMIYTLIQNPMLMNQMMNIINVLNYNPLILNQITNMMNQEIMMNNQMMQMMNMMNSGPMINEGNMDNNFEIKEQNENSGINIIFRKQLNPPIMIQCRKEDKVSDVIRKYRIESGDNDNKVKFIFNAMILNPLLTIEEAGMTENGNVFVVVTKDVKGG